MIEFDDQDALDIVGPKQRIARVHHHCRLVVLAVVVRLTRQIGIEVRIAGREPRFPMTVKMRMVIDVLHALPAGELMVDERRIRRIYGQQSGLMGTKAKIKVIVNDFMCFVKSAQTIEHLAPDQHARTSDRDGISLGLREAEISGLVLSGEAERMASDTVVGQEHTGMLDLPIWVQQARAGDADVRSLRMFHHGFQPVILDYFDVVVQK